MEKLSRSEHKENTNKVMTKERGTKIPKQFAGHEQCEKMYLVSNANYN